MDLIDYELMRAFSLYPNKIKLLAPYLSQKQLNFCSLPNQTYPFLHKVYKNKLIDDEIFSQKKELPSLVKIIKKDDVDSLSLLMILGGVEKLDEQISYSDIVFDYFSIAPIGLAIEYNAMRCFKFLLLNGVDPNQKYNEWDNLSIAAAKGQIQMMKILIENQYQVVSIKTAEAAAKFHQNHILKWVCDILLENEGNNFAFETILFQAILWNNLKGFGILSNKFNINYNWQNNIKFNASFLHTAVSSNSLKIVQILILNGANVNIKNNIFY